MSGFFHIPRALQIFNELEEEINEPHAEDCIVSIEFIDEKYKTKVYDYLILPSFEDAPATFVDYFIKEVAGLKNPKDDSVGKVMLKLENQILTAFEIYVFENNQILPDKSFIILKKANHPHDTHFHKLADSIVSQIQCKEAILLGSMKKAYYLTEKDKDSLKLPMLRHVLSTKAPKSENQSQIEKICPALEAPNAEQLTSFGAEMMKQYEEKQQIKTPATLFVSIEENYSKIRLSSLSVYNGVLRFMDWNEKKKLKINFEGFKEGDTEHLYL